MIFYVDKITYEITLKFTVKYEHMTFLKMQKVYEIDIY